MTERYASLAEVADLLLSEKEARGLLVTQNIAMEHAQLVSQISADDAKKLIEELKEVSPVTNFTAVKIADIMPRFPTEVRAIFSKERVVLENETINNIVELVAKYL